MNYVRRIRRELRNPDNRNKVIVLAALAVVFLVVFLLNTDVRSLLPDLRNYHMRQQEYEELELELNQARRELFAAQERSVRGNEVWSFAQSEDPRLAVLQKLESIAADCSINLRTTGNIKDVQLADGVLGYELDVNADAAELGNVCKFIIALALSHPKFFWDTITLRPSGSQVVLGGKLKVIVVTNKTAFSTYWGGADA